MTREDLVQRITEEVVRALREEAQDRAPGGTPDGAPGAAWSTPSANVSGRSLAECKAASTCPLSTAWSRSRVKKSASDERRSVCRSRSPGLDDETISNVAPPSSCDNRSRAAVVWTIASRLLRVATLKASDDSFIEFLVFVQ